MNKNYRIIMVALIAAIPAFAEDSLGQTRFISIDSIFESRTVSWPIVGDIHGTSSNGRVMFQRNIDKNDHPWHVNFGHILFVQDEIKMIHLNIKNGKTEPSFIEKFFGMNAVSVSNTITDDDKRIYMFNTGSSKKSRILLMEVSPLDSAIMVFIYYKEELDSIRKYWDVGDYSNLKFKKHHGINKGDSSEKGLWVDIVGRKLSLLDDPPLIKDYMIKEIDARDVDVSIGGKKQICEFNYRNSQIILSLYIHECFKVEGIEKADKFISSTSNLSDYLDLSKYNDVSFNSKIRKSEYVPSGGYASLYYWASFQKQGHIDIKLSTLPFFFKKEGS